MISIIVAISQENAIGMKGDLLCHLPADLKHFKTITSGHTVIMGERTFFSLPRHPLPNRTNIVLTDQAGKTFEGAQVAYSIPEVLAMVRPDEEAFICGGGMVYRQFMPIADKLYITHIHHSWPEADTFFPAIDPAIWQEVAREEHDADADNPFAFSFVTYSKKNNG